MRVCGYCGDTWRGGLGFAKGDIDLKFCRRACFQRWRDGVSLIPAEIMAIEQSLPAVGQHVASTGIGAKAFNDLSKDEVLGLIATSIKTFRVELEKVFDANDVPF